MHGQPSVTASSMNFYASIFFLFFPFLFQLSLLEKKTFLMTKRIIHDIYILSFHAFSKTQNCGPLIPPRSFNRNLIDKFYEL